MDYISSWEADSRSGIRNSTPFMEPERPARGADNLTAICEPIV
jgi:hypothetical protein